MGGAVRYSRTGEARVPPLLEHSVCLTPRRIDYQGRVHERTFEEYVSQFDQLIAPLALREMLLTAATQHSTSPLAHARSFLLLADQKQRVTGRTAGLSTGVL
ncbi:unnamed protein product [Sphagnum balticum]